MISLADYISHTKSNISESGGFTIDDEIAAEYIYAISNNDWSENDRLKDTEMWDSMGKKEQEYILQQSKFSGCIGTDTDELQLIKFVDFDHVYLQLCEVVSNMDGGAVPSDDNFGHFVICYKGHKPFMIQDLDHADWAEYSYAVNPRANWRNCVNKRNLEWILWEDMDELWIHNNPAYRSLVEYTGWSIWKDGKRIK